MKNTAVDNTKLGIFVLAGLFVLVLLLYMIGSNKSLFGSTFVVKAQFENVQGLVSGNNVRYAGIEVGTVSKVKILNDTLIEVTMLIEDDMQPHIRKNATASIGTDGLMGNKVVNITAGHGGSSQVSDGDILATHRSVDTDAMLRTLSKTNEHVAVIAENLKHTIEQLNNSTALWKLLNDNSLPQNIKSSAANLQAATARAAKTTGDIQTLITDVKSGKGSVGQILRDTTLAYNLNDALQKLRQVGTEAEKLVTTIDVAVKDVKQDIDSGDGPLNALLKDSSMVNKINSSLENLEKGTESFNENMEALKHNFLFRRYFRRLEKRNQSSQ